MDQDPKPILMQMSGELRFSKDGRWFHEDIEFTHEKVRNYFSRHLRFNELLKRYVVEAEGKCVPVTVEDTAVVVRTVTSESGSLMAVLGDGTIERFRADTLSVSAEPVYYCKCQNGARARLLAAAVQALIPFITQTAASEYSISLGLRSFPIARE